MDEKAYDDLEDSGWIAHSGTGSAHSVSTELDYDVVEALHRVVEEVTGKPVVRPRRRIGFL